MNDLDFFFSPSPTVVRSNGKEEDDDDDDDDDWGDFVDSSPRIASSSLSPSPNTNGADSYPDRIESAAKKIQSPWGTNSRGPLPLSVFGEEEAEKDETGSSSFDFSFDSFYGKHKDVSSSVNTNPSVGINGLISNLYRENGHKEQNSSEMNGKESFSSRRIEKSGVVLENLKWNPLNLDTESSVETNNVVNSSFADKIDEDVDDGWEFKTAESMFQTADRDYKEEQETSKSGSSVVSTVLSSSIWNPPTNGTSPNFDTSNTDAFKPVVDRESGDDNDQWGNGEWEFKVAVTGETENDLTNKESNGWGFGFGFQPVSKIEKTNSFQSNFEKEPQKRENGSISFPSNGNVGSEGASWAFNETYLETGDEKKEKEVDTDKPKGVLPLSFFEDEKLETSDTLVQEDNQVLVCDFSVKEKTKDPSPNLSINDLISSLYSQVEEKNAIYLSEKSRVVSVNAATDTNLVNSEDDSWEFQGSEEIIKDSSRTEGADDSWEFQGPLPALENSDFAEGVDEFDNDSWEFQGPTQPVKEDSGSLKSKHSSVENEFRNRFSVPNSFRESHEEAVNRIELNDYQEFFHKLKTELYFVSQNHLETLKEARVSAADSGEATEVQKCDSEIQDLQNWLKNNVLISEFNVESLQHRSSGIIELSKALQEPKFRALDSEHLLSERLLSAEKDWKSTIELFTHATLTLEIVNLGSPEQQSEYVSTWFVIASTCAQELRHASSIWKQVIENDLREEIISKPQGKSYLLSLGEIYRVVKILRASTRVYRPWILLATQSTDVLDVLDECVELWLSSGLEETHRQGLDSDYSADQLLESIKCIDEIDGLMLHNYITTSATSTSCYISGLNTEIVSGIESVEWNGDRYLLPLANLWANLISRDPPRLPGYCLPTVS
ncbi:unnamed protein product [Cochlearia groenlandica]